MSLQYHLLEGAGDDQEAAPNLPEGFVYQPDLICSADEDRLLANVRELPFRDFQFHGYTGKQRLVSFGWFSMTFKAPAVM